MSFLESPVFWGIVSIIGVAVGIMGTYLPNRKAIRYRISSTKVITGTAIGFPGLTVKLDDKPIQSLMIATVTFQNVGYQTITSSDIARAEPLGVRIWGECFGYTLSSSHSNSALTATQTRIDASEDTQGECTLNLDFDFLKRKDYLKISLWYDGTARACGELKSGKLEKDNKSKKDLAWCIYMELMYVIIAAALPLAWTQIIPSMIQPGNWSPYFVLNTALFCVSSLAAIVFEILLTIANIQVIHWASE